MNSARATGCATQALLVSVAISCAHAPRPPAPFRCPLRSVTTDGWRDIGIDEAPIVLRLPRSVRRYSPLRSPFYPAGWSIPDSAGAGASRAAAVLLADIRQDTIHGRDLRDFIANWFPHESRRACNVIAAKIDGRPLRITLFQGVDSSPDGTTSYPYDVDATIPLVGGAHPSWLYNGYAYATVGVDSILRIRASIFDDTLPPTVFLSVLSHIEPMTRH